jgi:hypothetical protein
LILSRILMLIIFEIYLKIFWGPVTYFDGTFDGTLHLQERFSVGAQWGAQPDVLVERRLVVDLGAFLPGPTEPPLPRVAGFSNLVLYTDDIV